MRTAPGISGELERLAASWGILTSFIGADGTTQQAGPDTLLALLRALGAPIERAGDAAELWRARAAEAVTMIPPVVVHRTERPGPIPLTLPARVQPDRVWLTLDLEDGSSRHEPMVAAIVGMESSRPGRADGCATRCYQVDVTRPRGSGLPPGYHSLTVEALASTGSALTSSARVISAPPCPRPARGWGMFMPLHALRTEGDWGIGSYTDLAQMGAWAGSLGASMVGGLPLYPSLLGAPADPSPYRPVTRLGYNEVFIDPTALPELGQSPEGQHLLSSSQFRERLERSRISTLVEYTEVASLRRQVLEPLARALLDRPSTRRDELEAFGRDHPELTAYARFRSSTDGQLPAPPGHARGLLRSDESLDEGIDGVIGDPSPGYHLYCQWVAATQLSAATALGSYADFPIGVHPDGFDPLWSPASFVTGAQGGAPPDRFYSQGQDWGFPPLHPERMRHDGYAYLTAALRRAFRHASALRIDHVMGLHRLYMIPEGADARQGAYVSYRADELHALVSLEAHRAGAVVIGEDLGTVPREVRRQMAADRMLRSWVFQFESTTEDPLPEPPRTALAALGTHDLPRFATYLWGGDIEERHRNGQVDAEEAAADEANRTLWRLSLLRALGIDPRASEDRDLTAAAHRGALSHLAASEADLVLIDLEELWGERAPQNHPGTGTEADNWRRRGACTLAEARANAGLTDLLVHLDRLRRGAAA